MGRHLQYWRFLRSRRKRLVKASYDPRHRCIGKERIVGSVHSVAPGTVGNLDCSMTWLLIVGEVCWQLLVVEGGPKI